MAVLGGFWQSGVWQLKGVCRAADAWLCPGLLKCRAIVLTFFFLNLWINKTLNTGNIYFQNMIKYQFSQLDQVISRRKREKM